MGITRVNNLTPLLTSDDDLSCDTVVLFVHMCILYRNVNFSTTTVLTNSVGPRSSIILSVLVRKE